MSRGSGIEQSPKLCYQPCCNSLSLEVRISGSPTPAAQNMAKKRTSSGGKAEASGSNYETLVATWYAQSVLLGAAARPAFGLRADSYLVSLACQTEAPVDDVNVLTSDAGFIFVQAKRTVALSSSAPAAFAKAIDQFVRQIQACLTKDPKHAWSRPLDPAKDRLVLATRTGSSSKITVTLPELLRRIRDQVGSQTLKSVASSQLEREVAKVVEGNLKRSWKRAFRATPTASELNVALRLIWIQVLDLDPDDRDRAHIIERFRTDLVEDPLQAGFAFSELFALAARLRAERSGADRPTLLQALAGAGVRLTALPDYRSDVRSLKGWTTDRVQAAPRFTRLLEDDPKLVIERAVWPGLRDAGYTQSLVVVGEPGAGKSGLMYRLAETAVRDGYDVVFLPVDLLNITTLSDLHNELRITHGLVDTLANWPGSRSGLVILDALDAARKPETQKLLREVVGGILRIQGARWKVVASVREYDLRQGVEWSAMFRGAPAVPGHADPEFAHVRHIAVGRLMDGEVAQIATLLPELEELYNQASDKLRELLRNIFNLHLLADLLRAGVAGSTLGAITNQAELLDNYWHHRVRRDDGKHDAREIALTVIVKNMIQTQSLRALRADVRQHLDAEALVDLERHGLLRAEDQTGRVNEDVLLFNHHVLFDYAVARLVFLRGRNPGRLVSMLLAQRELALMLSPSLTLALADLWHSDTSRRPFWHLAMALAGEDGLPAVAQLAGPMIAAEQAKDISDLAPLLETLKGPDPQRSIGEKVVQSTIGAVFVRKQAGAPLLGPAAGPWIIFAERLSTFGSDRVMLALRALIANAVDAL
jgi:hypothetical protein